MSELDVGQLISLALAGVAWVVGVWWWHRSARRKRLVEDVPTSGARGVFLGLTEVIGTATSYEPVLSPYGKEECVWWRYEIFEEGRDSRGRKTRRKVSERTGGHPFFDVRDESGAVRVWTPRAEVTAPKRHNEQLLTGLSDGVLAMRAAARRQRFVEEYTIPWESQVYVLGTARLPLDSLHPEISADPAGRDPFIIAVGSAEDVVRAERVASVIGALMALVAGSAIGFVLNQGSALWAEPGLTMAEVQWWAPIAGALVTGAVLAVLALVLLYNGIVMVGQRAQAAWGMLDVQLTRRHDLIPALEAVAHAHRSHEAELLPLLAELRSAPDLPGKPSDRAVRSAEVDLAKETSGLRHLVALAEAYPELRADETFGRLRDELVDTENRIALGRAFYNDSVERLRNRTEVFPGSLVAWFFEMDLHDEFIDVELPDRTPPRVELVADPFSV